MIVILNMQLRCTNVIHLYAFFLQVGNDDTKTVDDAMLIRKLLDKYEWLIDKAVNCKEMNDEKYCPSFMR